MSSYNLVDIYAIGRVRGIIAFQAITELDIKACLATKVAIGVATKKHGADAARVASTTIYLNSDGRPLSLSNGTLASTT